MPDVLPLLLAASILRSAVVGAVVGGLVGLGIAIYRAKTNKAEAATATAQTAGLSVEEERADDLPDGLGSVAIANAGRARRVTTVASGERDGHRFTTFGLRMQTGGRHTPTLRRYVAVHVAGAGTDPLHAVSLPAGAPEGILESFGHQSVDAPRTVRANDAEAAAAWASRPALLEAAGDDALIETGPAGLTLLIPGEPADAATLEDAIDRAIKAAR